MNKALGHVSLALMTLGIVAGPALASKTTIRTKGINANGSLYFEETKTCAGGSTGVDTTSVQVDITETTTSTQGSPSSALQSSVGVIRFDACNSVFSFGFGLFDNAGTLQLTTLQTGKIGGHFSLSDGTILDVNLTLTGSDTSSVGANTRRSVLGNQIVIQRSFGAYRTATVAGTVVVDGRSMSAAQALSADGTMARNTGGDITILKP